MNFIEAIGQIIYEKRFSLIALFLFALFFTYIFQPVLTWILRFLAIICTDVILKHINFIDDKRFRGLSEDYIFHDDPNLVSYFKLTSDKDVIAKSKGYKKLLRFFSSGQFD